MSKLLNNSIDELDALLISEYQTALNNVYNDMMDVYDKICQNGKPLKSHLYQYNRYYNLIEKINKRLKELGGKEVNLFTKHLTKLYKKNSKQICKQLNIVTEINESRIKTILKTPWIGEATYSDRIWKNKGELVTKLKDDLIQSVISGKSPEAYSANLQDNLITKGYYPIKRLVNTEMDRIYLQSTVDKYKEAGIQKITILTANDDRVCEKCKEVASEEYDIDEILDILPNHPNCRCAISAKI